MSTYQEFLAEIESRKCPECSGLGERDDSEPGDISYNTWKCKACRGTGFKDGQTYKATFVPGSHVRRRSTRLVLSGMAIPEVPESVHPYSWKQER